ncbi:Peptide transporter family 1 [Aphelenchoides fujianensis]|nr:Peptide transporter family 1 [Aphelenchoides fujianensis]
MEISHEIDPRLNDVMLTTGKLDNDERRAARRPAHPEPATSWGEMYRRWPKITFCIVTNEFCERFSYYGMRTVLTLYLVNMLGFNDANSTTFFSGFSALCYVSPILGSIIADGYIGKFKTIFLVSILYATGQIVLAFASTQHKGSSLHPWLDMAGLFIIAMGTGGIKPCVSPFGGDQFDPWETKMISLFFSVFYFSINAGSMISTFVAPIFRSLPCLGQDSCYPMAFGIPAVLMIVATIAFMLGSFWYKKKPPTSNVFADVWKVCTRALGQKFRASEPKPHWLDHALTKHDCECSPNCQALKRRRRDQSACAEAKFVEDVKSLFRVLIMYLPLPMFWALYDQQGSVWNLQAIRMNSRLWGTTLMLPDQMQTLNAVLILCFIPLFEGVIYPIVAKFCKITPLRKMVGGGLLASLAFVISALVQTQVNKTLEILPPGGHAYVSVMNTLPDCSVNATVRSNTAFIPPGASLENMHNNMTLFDIPTGSTEFKFAYSGGNCFADVLPPSATFDVSGGQIFFVHVSQYGVFLSPVTAKKPTAGTGEFASGVTIATDKNYDGNFAFCREGAKKTSKEKPCNPKQKSDYYFYERTDKGDDKPDWTFEHKYQTKSGESSTHVATVFDASPVRPGTWLLYYIAGTPGTVDEVNATYTGIRFQRLEQGGVYMLSLTGSFDSPVRQEFRVVQDNGMSILWQVPQIVVITAAEILFSITGLEFSYTQAAPSMKSIVGALFLLTTGIGDTCIVIFTLLFQNMNPVIVFFIYAALMFVVIVIFGFMAVFYYDYAQFDKEDDDEDSELLDSSSSGGDETSYNSKRPILLNGDSLVPAKDGAWDVRL